MDASKVNTAQFNAMCEQLSKLSGVPHGKIVKAEVGRVLEKTLQYTKVASSSKIRYRYDEFVPLSLESYSPAKIRRYGNVIGKGNYLVYYMQNRYSSELWSRLKARRVYLIARKIAAKGLAKRSWLDVAEMLGIRISGVPGYVERAIATTGKTYKNASVSEETNGKGVRITIVNAQPTVNAIGGARALQRAIQGRIKFFERNANLSVFADVKKTAKAYPGLKIKTA